MSVNGLGFSHAEVLSEVRNIEGLLTTLARQPRYIPGVEVPVTDHKVQGIRVFDARLAAVANTDGVGSILTFNAADSRRYGKITVLDPLSFLS